MSPAPETGETHLYGYREVLGSIPIGGHPNKFRIFWSTTSGSHVYFFTQKYDREFEKWIPVSSQLLTISGGTRIQKNKFDSCIDTLHRVIRYHEGEEFVFQIYVGDHRSIQRLKPDEISNPSNFDFNVEEYC